MDDYTRESLRFQAEYAQDKQLWFGRKELRHALRRADPAVFQNAMRYLEDDPYRFGSGYIKQLIWENIRRYELSQSDVERLRRAALKYLHRPMSREFKPMCIAMAYLGDVSFWQQVQVATETDDPRAQVNGNCLLAYEQGVMAGERERMALRCAKAWYPHHLRGRGC